MKERDFKRFRNFIVREGGKELTHYYRVKTAHPQIEWKFRPGTLMYSLLNEYSSNPTLQNEEVIVTVLVALYYVSTASDPSLIKMVYEHIQSVIINAKPQEEDEGIEDAKNSFITQEILKGGIKNEQA